MAEVTPRISLDQSSNPETARIEPVAVLMNDDALVVEKNRSEVFKAGSTLPRTQGDHAPCTWSDCSSSRFSLRVGPDYSRNKQKASSPHPIMEVVGVE